jgi:hypothetical protein
MPLRLEIIRAAEFVCVGAEGKFDLAASKAALAALATACRKRGIQHAIVDLRTVNPGPKPMFTPGDLVALVNTFPEVVFTRDRLRLAVLYRSDPHKRARMFSFLSTLHGWSVQPFGDFEQALLWLSKGEEAAAAPARQPTSKQPVPVRYVDGGPAPKRPGGPLRHRGPQTS